MNDYTIQIGVGQSTANGRFYYLLINEEDDIYIVETKIQVVNRAKEMMRPNISAEKLINLKSERERIPQWEEHIDFKPISETKLEHFRKLLVL